MEDHVTWKIQPGFLLIAGICCSLLLPSISAGESNIDPSNEGKRYAYGENIGWANFKPNPLDGVRITDTLVSGYIWCENIGWILLDPEYGGVFNDGLGNLSGWAWGENVGWISFSCRTTKSCDTIRYGISVDAGTGVFKGYGWGENIGWLSLAPQKPNQFTVTTAWRDVELPGDLNDDGSLDLADVILGLQVCTGQRPSAVLHSLADINGDRQLGMADVLYILGHVAGEITPSQ